MTHAPRRPCSTPNCRAFVRGPGPCPRCARKRDRARGTAQQRGYTHAWAEYSRAWLARFPWCGQRLGGVFHDEHSRCVQRGERVRATVTDHIVAIRDGGEMFDPENHQSLCVACNVAKSSAARREQAKRGAPEFL